MDRTHSRSKPVNEKTPTPSQPRGSQHVLPPLPYDYSALEPIIDTATMKLHHDEHHATYVDKLNEAIAPYPNLRERSATWLLLNGESVPESVRKLVHENAGGHVNHSLFWRLMSQPNTSGPTGTLARALDSAFGSVDTFKSRFDELGGKVFGSGWVWLVSDCDTRKPKLEIVTTSGHGNPIEQGRFPLLVNDVWEHAYYLKHQNRRPEYLKAWWSVVNWKEVQRRFDEVHEASTTAAD